MEDISFVELFVNHIWAVRYEGQLNEWLKLLRKWHDVDALVEFFKENSQYMDNEIWRKAGLDPKKPEKSAQRVITEANELELLLIRLYKNTLSGNHPDFDDYFKPLNDCPNKCYTELEPYKSYGPRSPSLLRLYAIKLDSNQYMLVTGGIKLARKIQTSPGLHPQILNSIDNVTRYLMQNGITEADDI